MSNEDRSIDILLAEYQACHMTRDCYTNSRWNMGAIFMAASLILLGISFEEQMSTRPIDVILMGISSLSALFIWLLFNKHLTPWILTSIDRARQIEDELIERGYEIRLHHLIQAGDEESKKRLGIRYFSGKQIGYLLYIIVIVWIVRLFLLIN